MLVVSKAVARPKVQYTPDGFKKARKAMDQGDWRKLIAMMQEAALDSHVSGCIMGRNAGYMRDFEIVADDDAEVNAERRDWLHGVLSRLNTRKLFKRIQEAVRYKYSVIDFEWELIAGRDTPVSFKHFEQKYFKYDTEGALRIEFGAELREIPAEALVCETDETPIMLPVLRDWILKDFGIEAWAAFLENFGEPFILGLYPPGADDTLRKEVDDAVNALAASSRGSGPQGTDLKIIEAGKNTGDHERFEMRCNKGISITLLGHANAVEDSSGMKIGENLAPFKVRRDIALDDLYFIEENLNRLLRLIQERNFGDGNFLRIELDKSEPVNHSEHRDNVDLAYRHGVTLDPDEYRKLGLYIAPEQEPIQRPANPLNLLD